MTCLVEVLLVDLLRQQMLQGDQESSGLLAALGDPVATHALSAMHEDVTHDWTVADLARNCKVSRSAFAAHFHKIVGLGPIDYLLRWRMTLARDELRQGKKSIGERLLLRFGFQSSSAFSTAFTRATGCSPRQFQTRG